ncbi:MAG: GDP-mannose 4,6-dehydratase [Candidatus Omnitrophota bacterium]
MPNYQGWFYDLETTSGEFHCGIGKIHVHNSPRRGETFVSRKITRAVADIIVGKQDKLYLGNLEAKRDWGFAPEYAQMMWLMLQQDKPDDYVIGTGESHSVKEFVEQSFKYAGITLVWEGRGVKEKGFIKHLDKQVTKINKRLAIGNALIVIDPRYFRPNEVNHLRADISKAKQYLKWQPKINFNTLVQIMVDYDLKSAGIIPSGKGIQYCKDAGLDYTNHEYSK